MSTQLILTTKDSGRIKIRSISNANPKCTGVNLKAFAQRLWALSKNILVDVERVSRVSLTTGIEDEPAANDEEVAGFLNTAFAVGKSYDVAQDITTYLDEMLAGGNSAVEADVESYFQDCLSS